MSVMQLLFNTATFSTDVCHGRYLGNGSRIHTLIMTSLLTDAYAENVEDLPAGETDRHGCWSDTFHPAGRGSLLWTLKREKLTQQVMNRAKDMCDAALQWLVDDNELLSLRVDVQKIGSHRAAITVFYTDLNGDENVFIQELNTNAL